MKTSIRIIFCLLIAWFHTCAVYTQTTEEKNTDERSFLALPVFLYTTDTGAGFGAAGIKSYNRKLPRSSIAAFNAILTTKKQFVAAVKIEHFFNDGNNRILAEMKYTKFPTEFYGLGNTTDNADPESYTPETFYFKAFYEHRVYRSLKLRPSITIRNHAVVKKEDSGAIASGNIPWAQGRLDIGPGLGIVWDTRDNTQATISGQFIALDYYRFLYQNDGDGFSLLSLDMRSFVNPIGGTVIATQIKFRDTNGDVPYYHYSQLGGDEFLRGYESSRFMDKSLFLVQQDIRFPIWWRIGGAIFVAAGQVAPELSDVFSGTFHVAYGIGARFSINKEDRLQLRADLAFSEDSDGFYISFGEAF